MVRRLLVPLSLLQACIVLEVREGSGIPATQSREVGAFSGVRADASVNVEIEEGDTPGATVTCDDNLVDDVRLEHDGDVLVVTTDAAGQVGSLFHPRTDCRVNLVTPDLASVETTSSADILVSGQEPVALELARATGSGDIALQWPIASERLVVEATGSGGIDVDSLDAGQASLRTSGSGDLSVRVGGADGLELSSSGSGGVWASGVTATRVSASLSGSGDGEVTVTDELEARLSGSGDLTVWGAPAERDIVTSGSGDVLMGD